ncbi:MAG: twitching motility protein PilT [Butyrivibrio sp.]|uniref:Twitching motility protein PilT n=1 Tax=Butyrivibrio hungatei TaxID=185008 RepID=A0A1G5AVP2_9FIRM|nr:twitching motility protein PilT [Butyrivibrio hungatei]MBQ4220014.1 twitching motility protein PilT [Butyrivibrio sp.]MBR4358286.1 twitching motility protein PilT [Butyrivibrio sp.]MBR4640461.1 twitching motility protein PilT [Butyrivibrio sp.]MCR4996852.1 twitching motility protein PilT [Butyrivibrio sp.]MEE3470721.1 twitching motility protein PilT [Butyrivibrio hungatei]
MVQLIVGKKGKGKTKCLLDKVNTEVKNVLGSIAFLDKSTKHMYELNNKIRLIVVSEFMIENSDEFIGFVSGIISQDHDLQQMYFDSFLKISCLEGKDISGTIDKLEKLGEKFNIDFVLSLSMDESELPESVKSNVVISL